MVEISTPISRSTDASKLDYYEIPVIDWQLSDKDKPLFLRQLRDAMINIGFLYLANHPVPHEVIAQVKKIAPKFFELPQESKDMLDMKNSMHFHGYLKVSGATLSNDASVREQFNFGGARTCSWKEGEPEYFKLHGEALVSVVETVTHRQDAHWQYLLISLASSGLRNKIFLSFGIQC